MTEALEIAKKRRDALAAEIGKLDDYICIWEKLVGNGGNDAEEEHESSPLIFFCRHKGTERILHQLP